MRPWLLSRGRGKAATKAVACVLPWGRGCEATERKPAAQTRSGPMWGFNGAVAVKPRRVFPLARGHAAPGASMGPWL